MNLHYSSELKHIKIRFIKLMPCLGSQLTEHLLETKLLSIKKYTTGIRIKISFISHAVKLIIEINDKAMCPSTNR